MGLKILFNFSAEKSNNKIYMQALSFAGSGLEVCLCVPAGPTQREDKKPDNASCSTAVEIMKDHLKRGVWGFFSRYVSHFLHLVFRGGWEGDTVVLV